MKYTVHRAFKDLGAIDKAHESGRITKAQHDSKSKKVLKKLNKGQIADFLKKHKTKVKITKR